MTNFFGSVMKTIHTSSAYRAISGLDSSRAKFVASSDKSYDRDAQRITNNPDPEKDSYHYMAKVSVLNFLERNLEVVILTHLLFNGSV